MYFYFKTHWYIIVYWEELGGFRDKIDTHYLLTVIKNCQTW
jgi:hypothetical protein